MFCINTVRLELTRVIRNISFKSVKCLYGVPYYIVRVRLIGPLKYPTKVVVEDTSLTPNGSHALCTITTLIVWETPIPNLLVFLTPTGGKKWSSL